MKKGIQFLLVATLSLSLTISSFAAPLFSDVSTSHWALPAIKTVSEKNIMPGYGDASFKPLQKVSKVEVAVVAYRLLKESGKLGTFSAVESVKKNKEVLTSAKIPAILAPYNSEIYTALSFSLDRKLIDKDDLKHYVLSGKLVEATKEEISTVLGKTLNSVKNQTLTGKIIAFSYADASDINSLYAPYINLLVDYKLIDKKGDSKSKFNPKSNMGRDGLASMASGVYKAFGSEVTPTTSTTSTTPTTPKVTPVTPVVTVPKVPVAPTTLPVAPVTPVKSLETTTVSGTVTAIFIDKISVEVKDSLSKVNTFELSGTEIIKNNMSMGFLNLVVGDNLILNLNNGKVTKAIVEKNYSKAEGNFVELSKVVIDNTTKKSFRVVTITKPDGKLDYYKIETGLYVELDRFVKQIEDLTKGDKLTISFDGYFARKIEAFSAKSEVMLILSKIADFKIGSSVTYKLPDGRVMEYLFKAEPEIVKIAGKDLRKGDIVKATFAYGTLKKIESTGLVSEDSGSIREILISDMASKITILNKQNERKTYNVQTKVAMTIGEIKTNSDGLYQLRMGQDVNLDIDALGIYNVAVLKISEKTKLSMTLMELVNGNLLKATDAAGKIWVINMKEGSAILENFKAGDKIDVTGTTLSDLIFEAELMTKIN